MSSYKKRERRQVSFNTEDAIELELLQFADREDINFSGLVKHLLFAYRMGQIQPSSPSTHSFDPQLMTPSLGSTRPDMTANIQRIKASGMPFDL
ncbi:hypothetical protein [Hazenella coriacea]|uniref:Uncharacterized protein n=1 Tax=Hazenella coriacea TaxID=1179467 RepID=A0A4R3L7N7_9BACL|nr:hypothetical protein [Hazenella coriacea]TCS95542.1 hypothetical protein EDD58_102115 [Hazenella coriacea]